MLPVPTLQFLAHPQGEADSATPLSHNDTFVVPTPGGIFHVSYDPTAEVSHLGGMVPFAQFLHASALFDAWVGDAPLNYNGNRALGVREVLGTQVLSMLSGHYRFAHIASLRGDTVTPQLLGMKQVASEDTVRRALLRLVKGPDNFATSMAWLRRHLVGTLSPLMEEKWTLDIDVTVKPVYGYQEGSVVGYNAQKPGRPSHALHSFVMAQTRLVVDVAVHAGNETSSNHTLLELQRVLSGIPSHRWPTLLRGDCAFGTDDIMSWCESVGLPYLFKQRLTTNTKHLIRELDFTNGWKDAGQGWQGKESTLKLSTWDKPKLSTWDKPRKVVVLRRPNQGPRYPRGKDIDAKNTPKQQVLETCQPYIISDEYEYQVLVTTLQEDVPTIAQRYRDRSDVENVFDEIKNQWGWGGFTSKTFAVTQAVAVIAALVYNWWSIFSRIADPEHHHEAITTRPTLLHGVIRQTTHANMRILTVTSTNHNKAGIATFCAKIGQWLSNVKAIAEQWTTPNRWTYILKTIFAGQLGILTPKTT